MKKIFFFCLILCLVLQCAPFSALAAAVQDNTTPPTETDPLTDMPAPDSGEVVDASVAYGADSLDAQVPLGGKAQKLETAKAALLFEVNTGTMLYSWNPDARMHPASLVKVMTAMIAVEEGDLSETVTVTADMLSALRDDQLYTDLKEGEQVTLGDLVYNTMVASSNAASALIAMHLSGSESAFVAKMNARARELGCTATNFVNSHGIPHDDQYTTARDMARIVLNAIQSETFCEIFGAKDYTIPATNLSESRYLRTTNYFLSNEVVQKFYDPRVTGGKSGAAATEDRSVVFTAESGDVKLLGVVMGAVGKVSEDGNSILHHGSFEEATELLNFGFDQYTTAQILHEGKSVAQFLVENGTNDVVARPASSAASALPAGTELEDLTWKYLLREDLTAPVDAGADIGTVQVWWGSICIAQSPMISMNGSRLASAPPADQAKAPVTEHDGGGLSTVLMVLGIILGAVLILFVIGFGLNAIRAAALRSRRRRRRKNRRRSR